MKISLSKCLVAVFATSLLAVSCFAADDPGEPTVIPFHKKKDKEEKDKKAPKQLVSSSVKVSETPLPRVWIGLTGSITPLKLVHASANGLTDAALDSITGKPANGFVGGGLTVNARILRNFWISAGAIYRFAGYDWNLVTTDAFGDAFVQRSRVRLLDFPVLVKYTGRKWNLSKYTFYEVGGAYRDSLSRVTTTNQSQPGVLNAGTGDVSALGLYPSYRKNYFGAVAGVGLSAKDDFGIIVSPEVRYTRWMGDTFGGPVVSTPRNQLEITVSFGF